MTQRFSGKTVLVTGAAGGIGLAAATAFAQEGANVVLADRDTIRVEAAAQSLSTAGLSASAVTVDVSNFASCQAMVAHTLATFGQLDIAFNNAGIPSALGIAFEDVPVEDWRNILDVNVSGMFYCMKAEVPAMKAAGGGAIVNTASVASIIAAKGMAAYVASKHAVAGLTKAAALDLIGSNIRVNAIAPGSVNTPMLAPLMADPVNSGAIAASVPAGRVGEPGEIANAVLFLASSDASYMVGALVCVDGGVVIQ